MHKSSGFLAIKQKSIKKSKILQKKKNLKQ